MGTSKKTIFSRVLLPLTLFSFPTLCTDYFIKKVCSSDANLDSEKVFTRNFFVDSHLIHEIYAPKYYKQN